LKKIILLLLLYPLSAFAQNIKGRVFDRKNNSPIQDANISWNQSDEKTTSDEKGSYYLKTSKKPQENDTLYVSHLGYVSTKVSFFELKKNNYLIFLDEQIEYLNGVTLSSTRKELKSKISFTKLASLKYGISSFGSVLNNNKIYVIGGDGSFKTDAWKKLRYDKPDFTLDDFLRELQFQFSGQYYKGNLMIYDIKTDQWETSKIKFRKRAYHNLNIYNNTIFALGGKRISANGRFEYLDDKIEVFDINKETVTIDNTNPHQAVNFASFTYNGAIITLGGSIKMTENGKKTYTDKVHLYNVNSGFWYELANMPTAKEVNGTLIKDKIYLIGGTNGKALSSIESFDLTAETWKTEGELFTSVDYPAITNKNDTIYFFEDGKIYTYDILTKTLKEYLIALPLKVSKLYFCDDKLYLLGGYAENYYSQYPSSNLYSIDINDFENTKPNRIKIL
jgi:hypothetical protein